MTSNRMAAPPIVLIHGAWQGSWSFAAFTPHMQALGWSVHAVDLPGNGHSHSSHPATLEGYTAHVLEVLDTLEAPAVILGHSGGGLVATQVAQAAPERVRAAVYLAGMMLPAGWGLSHVIDACRTADPAFTYTGVTPHLQWSSDGSHSTVPAQAAIELFMHDCPPAAAQAAATRLTPQPESGRAVRSHWTAERFGQIPRVYVECLHDRSITLPLQRCMQQLVPGAIRISLPCGHVPQLACPAELARRLHTVFVEAQA